MQEYESDFEEATDSDGERSPRDAKGSEKMDARSSLQEPAAVADSGGSPVIGIRGKTLRGPVGSDRAQQVPLETETPESSMSLVLPSRVHGSQKKLILPVKKADPAYRRSRAAVGSHPSRRFRGRRSNLALFCSSTGSWCPFCGWSQCRQVCLTCRRSRPTKCT